MSQPFVWCLAANVIEEPHLSKTGGAYAEGIAPFAPGAMVYCFPKSPFDSSSRLRVMGRPGGRGEVFVARTVAMKWLTNYRALRTTKMAVVSVLREAGWDDDVMSRELAEATAGLLNVKGA